MNSKVITKLVCLLISIFVLSSCVNPLTKYYVKKSDVEKQIESLNVKHDADVAAAESKISTKKDETIGSQDKQLQEIANKLFAAQQGFHFYTNPGRVDLIINNRVTEAQAAVGKGPTYEAMIAENKRLTTEMDEQLTSLAKLKADHDKVVQDNTKLAEETAKEKKALEELNKAKLEADTKYINDKKVLDKNLEEANKNIQAKLTEEADSAKATKELKQKLMMWCGGFALIAMVGAIYSPIGKQGLLIIAISLGGAAAAIPFIEGWMVLVGILVIIAVVIGYLLYKHRVADVANTNMVHAIQDTIETKGATSATLKANLSAWNTKYTKDQNGDTVTVTDNKIESYIEDKLKSIGRLTTPTDPVVPVSPVPTPTPTPEPTKQVLL